MHTNKPAFLAVQYATVINVFLFINLIFRLHKPLIDLASFVLLFLSLSTDVLEITPWKNYFQEKKKKKTKQ